MEKTANRLKQLRVQKHLTLQDLSSLLSKSKGIYISPDSLAKYERGERKPKIDKLEALADFFGVSIAYLKGITDTQMSFEQLTHEYDLLLADYHRLCRVHDADLEEIETLKDQLNFYRSKFNSKEQ